MHISQLRDDYYQFDSTFHRLVCERTGRRFAIGEPVRIKVAAVNLDERKMDFQLITGGGTGKRSMRERMSDESGFEVQRSAPKKKSGSRTKSSSNAPTHDGSAKPAKRDGAKPDIAKSGASKPRARKR